MHSLAASVSSVPGPERGHRFRTHGTHGRSNLPINRTLGPSGRVWRMSAGPSSATTGVPRAAARCIGPVSFVTRASHPASTSARPARSVRPPRSSHSPYARPARVTISVSLSSPGPPRTRTRIPASASLPASAENRPAGQRRDSAFAPGNRATTRGPDPGARTVTAAGRVKHGRRGLAARIRPHQGQELVHPVPLEQRTPGDRIGEQPCAPPAGRASPARETAEPEHQGAGRRRREENAATSSRVPHLAPPAADVASVPDRKPPDIQTGHVKNRLHPRSELHPRTPSRFALRRGHVAERGQGEDQLAEVIRGPDDETAGPVSHRPGERRETPPAGSPPIPPVSCAASLPSASRGASACA